MESIIAVDMKSFIYSNGLISDHQFGLRPGHSTLEMLLLLSQQLMEALNVRHKIRAISLDISQASNAVWHPTLFAKVSAYGIQGQLHSGSWFPPLSQPKCGSQRNPFISSPCQGWSAPRQCSRPHTIPNFHQWSHWLSGKSSLSLCIMTQLYGLTSLILLTDRQKALPSPQTLTKSQQT